MIVGLWRRTDADRDVTGLEELGVSEEGDGGAFCILEKEMVVDSAAEHRDGGGEQQRDHHFSCPFALGKLRFDIHLLRV